MTLLNLFPVPVYEKVLEGNDLLNSKIVEYAQQLQRDYPSGGKEDKVNWNYLCGIWTSINVVENLLESDNILFTELRNQIAECTHEYLNMLHIKHQNISIQGSWLNINKYMQFQEFHEHIGSLQQFSGTYYVKIPQTSGNLVFRHPNYQVMDLWSRINNFLPIIHTVIPVESKLVLFPAWFTHMVEKNETRDDRISIAFNLHVHI